jgi:DNA replication and repair protein RecF
LVAEIIRGKDLRRIEIRLLLEGKDGENGGRTRKEVYINGVKRRVGDLAGEFIAVLFHPHDLQIIEGSRGLRRRFLDATISQADPLYARALRRYGKILTQRNALLKQIQEGAARPGQLRYWDEQTSELAAQLIRARAVALHELEQRAEPIHKQLTHEVEVLRLRYSPAYDPQGTREGQLGLPMKGTFDWVGISQESLRSGLMGALEAARRQEVARGITLIGPHRDDFSFLSNGLNLNTFGSRGQNRTAMLALKLSQVDWLRERTGHWPVLLLDEVLAELDVQRRSDLLERVSEAQQALLTTTDLDMIDRAFLQETPVWRIRSGTIMKD